MREATGPTRMTKLGTSEQLPCPVADRASADFIQDLGEYTISAHVHIQLEGILKVLAPECLALYPLLARCFGDVLSVARGRG